MTPRVVTILGAVGIIAVTGVTGFGIGGLLGAVIPDTDAAYVVAFLVGVLLGALGAAAATDWLRRRSGAR